MLARPCCTFLFITLTSCQCNQLHIGSSSVVSYCYIVFIYHNLISITENVNSLYSPTSLLITISPIECIEERRVEKVMLTWDVGLNGHFLFCNLCVPVNYCCCLIVCFVHSSLVLMLEKKWHPLFFPMSIR